MGAVRWAALREVCQVQTFSADPDKRLKAKTKVRVS